MMDAMNEAMHAAELEQTIDDVAASYKTELEINNLQSAALPNRKAVIDAYSQLLAALFLGFYSKRALNTDNLRHTLSEALYPAYEGFVRQIQRAATYEESMGRRAAPGPDWSAKVVLELFGALPALRTRLNSDVLAAYDGDPAVRSVEEVVFSLPGLRAITAHRVAHFLYQRGVPMIPRIISEYAHSQTGIDIHAGAQIGDHFFIDHGTGVVIGETTSIGNNVKIYQNVTLGALSIPRNQRLGDAAPKKRHPTIEDDVTIYTGATILGGDTVIGRGSVIGANAWLMQSVPPGTRIMGRQAD
jgi:serine O-acetyltransferase